MSNNKEAGRTGSVSFSKGRAGNEKAIIHQNHDIRIPFIKTKLDVVLYNAFPFNLLKGLVITGFTMLVYKRIRPLLKGRE